ncbi:MAG: hypothetical protein GXO64_04980 [Candidatus Micrarchaeota archaeon]|nr:hypothetical protein [Candidatus Micrarchaeota archaeon]
MISLDNPENEKYGGNDLYEQPDMDIDVNESYIPETLERPKDGSHEIEAVSSVNQTLHEKRGPYGIRKVKSKYDSFDPMSYLGRYIKTQDIGENKTDEVTLVDPTKEDPSQFFHMMASVTEKNIQEMHMERFGNRTTKTSSLLAKSTLLR